MTRLLPLFHLTYNITITTTIMSPCIESRFTLALFLLASSLFAASASNDAIGHGKGGGSADLEKEADKTGGKKSTDGEPSRFLTLWLCPFSSSSVWAVCLGFPLEGGGDDGTKASTRFCLVLDLGLPKSIIMSASLEIFTAILPFIRLL